MKMRIIKLGLLSIAILLFLCSCSPGGSRTKLLNMDTSEEKADDRLKQTIEIINTSNKDSLKTIFSEQALDEAEDLDKRMDYLFDFVQEDINSWETIVHGATTESVNHGSQVKYSSSWYFVNTDTQKYLIFFLECTADTDHPENVGVYMLQVIKAEDKATQFDGGGPDTTRCAGIYYPTTKETN